MNKGPNFRKEKYAELKRSRLTKDQIMLEYADSHANSHSKIQASEVKSLAINGLVEMLVSFLAKNIFYYLTHRNEFIALVKEVKAQLDELRDLLKK